MGWKEGCPGEWRCLSLTLTLSLSHFLSFPLSQAHRHSSQHISRSSWNHHPQERMECPMGCFVIWHWVSQSAESSHYSFGDSFICTDEDCAKPTFSPGKGARRTSSTLVDHQVRQGLFSVIFDARKVLEQPFDSTHGLLMNVSTVHPRSVSLGLPCHL
jgi:hypothetical protein